MKKKITKISLDSIGNSSDVKWLIIAAVLFVVYLGLNFISSVTEPGSGSEGDYNVEIVGGAENGINSETENITFKEDDDNTQYSYIINPGILSSYNIGAERIQSIPDEINRVLLNQNIKGAKLQIVSPQKKGVELTFTVKVLEHDTYLTVKYNERLGTIEIE